MDFSGGSLDRLTAQVQPAINTFLAAVKDDEATAIAALHSEIAGIVKAETDLVASLFSELDQRIGKFAAIAKATADALSAAFPVEL